MGLLDWWKGPSSTDSPNYGPGSGFEVNPNTYGPSPPAGFAGSQMGQMGGQMNPMGMGLGMNVGTGQLALGGLSALGNLWTGFNAAGLAKKQFDFTSRIADTNLRNQTQAYNTTLDDKARVRGVMEGQSSEQVEDYKNRNRLRV